MPNAQEIRPLVAAAVLAVATLAVLVVLAFAASQSAAMEPPDCINVTAGVGADVGGCISPDGVPPPEVFVNGLLVNGGHP